MLPLWEGEKSQLRFVQLNYRRAGFKERGGGGWGTSSSFKKIFSLTGDLGSDDFRAKLVLQSSHKLIGGFRIFNPNVIIGFDNQALVK